MDFRNLNRGTPKDEYMMPVADLLIDSTSGNNVISFLDGNAGYNQIFMAKEDVSKTAFCCPGFIALFEWVIMTFGLKNAGATYHRAMNLIFHDLLRVLMEVYIDDVVVKSVGFEEHMTDLKLSLERMKKHEHSIQIDPKKIESIRNIGEPVCKKDIQKLLGKINYLRRFISNLAGWVESLLPLVRLKHEEFIRGGGAEEQEAFEKIEEYLMSPPVLRALKTRNPFNIHLERVSGHRSSQHRWRHEVFFDLLKSFSLL
jgi:hypothetical protein